MSDGAPEILAGTDDGLHRLGSDPGIELAGARVGAIAPAGDELLAIAGEEVLVRERVEGWRPLAALPAHEARCLLALDDELLIGTSEAHLYQLSAGAFEPLEGFEAIAGRERWFTPWGGPPATRSLSEGAAGELYALVHVGGIPRSSDGGATWRPTIEIEVDAHEVRSPAERPGLVLAATAHGLAVSRDSGETWKLADAGLHSSYCRAIALAGETVLLSASDGPRGGRGALYRRPLEGGSLVRCTAGLPEWFGDNIDTACLQAAGHWAAFGTAVGTVHRSADGGETWETVAEGLAPVRCLALAA